MTQAVILAAGFGSRLRPLTDDRPKALVPFGSLPVIGHALDALVEAGVKQAIVVTGYHGDALESYLADRAEISAVTVENPDYATTNTLASFAAVAHLVDDDFFLIDGDLVFEPAIVSRLLGPGTRLAVDPSHALDDEAVKVAAEGERITAVGKQLPPPHVPVGESIGMAKIDVQTGERLFVVARQLLRSGARQAYYEAAFDRLIAEGDVFELADVTGLKWVEIDDHADLARATALFLDR
jgi:choline kinase